MEQVRAKTVLRHPTRERRLPVKPFAEKNDQSKAENFPNGEVATALGSHRENVSSSPTGAYMSLDTLSADVSLSLCTIRKHESLR